MSLWPQVKIRDVTTKVGSGATPRGGESAYKQTGVPLIRSMNVHFAGFRRDGLAFLDEKQAADLDGATVHASDVLLNITGASIGRVTFAPEDMDGARVNQHVCIIRPTDLLEPKFLAHFLASPGQQDRIMREQVGATRQGLTKARILDFEVPLPSVPHQRRIVAKIEELFSDLDAGVAALKRVKANLKRYRAAVLKAAVEGRLTEEWRNKNPATEPATKLLERIITERRAKWQQDQLRKFKEAGRTPPKGWRDKYVVPAGPESCPSWMAPSWKWCGLGQCFDVCVGATPARMVAAYWGGEIPWVSSGEVQFCRIRTTREHITSEGLQNSSTRLNPAGSVLLGMIGEGRTRGQAAILDIDATNNQNCAAVWVSKTPVHPEWVYYWFCSQYEATRRASSGNNQPALNKARVQAMEFPLPPLEEQSLVVAEVERRMSIVDAAESEVERGLCRAARLRQAILKRAFEGKLVPQDPIDEPAAALLERVEAESNGHGTKMHGKYNGASKATKNRSPARL